MKLVAQGTLRFGLKRYEHGEQFTAPDSFGRALVASGKAVAIDEAVGEKAAPEAPAKGKKTYKTRKLEAEDT
jgi:hypothetical protein